jgi:hypothetical protein
MSHLLQLCFTSGAVPFGLGYTSEFSLLECMQDSEGIVQAFTRIIVKFYKKNARTIFLLRYKQFLIDGVEAV